MSGRRKRIGLIDVAQAVGVAPSTVSNAFNRPDQLSAELREHILETAAELGYAGPDPVARSLRSGRAGVIGVTFYNELSYAFRDPAAAEVLGGVAEVVGGRDLALVLVQGSHAGASNGTAVRRAAVDGFVAQGLAQDNALLRATLERRLPTVLMDEHASAEHDFIGIDDEAAARVAVGHLLELGHRAMAVVTLGPIGSASSQAVTRRRIDGSLRALEGAGIDPAAVPFVDPPALTAEAGRAATRALLERHADVTAIFAFSDVLAAGAVMAAQEMGRTVPRDLSIVGFDDTVAATHGLTTIRQPLREKGRVAAERLLARVDGDTDPPRALLLPTELVGRRSTAPPPHRRGNELTRGRR